MCLPRLSSWRVWLEPIGKKISKRKDVIFLEDQTIEDFEKVEKQITSVDTRSYINVAP